MLNLKSDNFLNFFSKPIFKKIYFEVLRLAKNAFQLFVEIFEKILRGRFKVLFYFLSDLITSVNSTLEKLSLKYRYKSFGYDPTALKNLSLHARGVHKLLENPQWTYSILIPVFKPSLEYFKKTIESCLEQSAKNLNILIGLDGEQPKEIMSYLIETQRMHPEVVFCFQFEKQGISKTLNKLASKSKQRFLLLMDHDDWIRPDLLLRYEQTLRLKGDPDNYILYCDEFKIDENDQKINGSEFFKSTPIHFPYFFANSILHCLLISNQSFRNAGGFRSEYDGAQDYEFCLRLSENPNSKFLRVPFLMYAWRAHQNSTAKNSDSKKYANDAGIEALRSYVERHHLRWDVTSGHLVTTYRAIPERSNMNKTVHVIIPFKNQKTLTLKCVQHVLAQREVNLKVTAISNNSSDLTVEAELLKLGIECLTLNETFNFSSLNNFAVQHSEFQNSDYLLFLNNDVLLEPSALEEMLRWIDQPKVGIVGCRLHYPNQKLQHGGIVLDEQGPARQINWVHRELGLPLQELALSKIISTVPAVTGACLLISKQDFLNLSGFDKIYFPNSLSDADLCKRLTDRGKLCLYTPFASGVHYESFTRSRNNIEDFEFSTWLADQRSNST